MSTQEEVHADVTISIDGHESDRRIHRVVHDVEVRARNRCPIMDARTAHGIDAHLDASVADHVHVDTLPRSLT